MDDERKGPDEEDVRDYIDLDRFIGDVPEIATFAFQSLWKRRERSLRAELRRMGVTSTDQQTEVLQEAAVRIWSARVKYQNRGPQAWRAYARTTVRRCYFDSQREGQPEYALSEVEEEMDREFVSLLIAASEAAWFFRQADILWLGLDPERPELHDRQILAGLLFYVDDWSWGEILEHLNNSKPTTLEVKRSDLDCWLASPGVLRAVAYQELYATNVEISALLLGVSPCPSSLDALLISSADAPRCLHDWTGAEVRVILWRFYRVLLLEEILARPDTKLNPPELRSLFARCVDKFPFKEKIAQLAEKIEAAPGPGALSCLASTGLWKRLAFQYRLKEELKHKDIVDRLSRPAEHVGFSLTEATLNPWLSRGDIYRELAKYCNV